jgi:hypothetical protein
MIMEMHFIGNPAMDLKPVPAALRGGFLDHGD